MTGRRWTGRSRRSRRSRPASRPSMARCPARASTAAAAPPDRQPIAHRCSLFKQRPGSTREASGDGCSTARQSPRTSCRSDQKKKGALSVCCARSHLDRTCRPGIRSRRVRGGRTVGRMSRTEERSRLRRRPLVVPRYVVNHSDGCLDAFHAPKQRLPSRAEGERQGGQMNAAATIAPAPQHLRALARANEVRLRAQSSSVRWRRARSLPRTSSSNARGRPPR